MMHIVYVIAGGVCAAWWGWRAAWLWYWRRLADAIVLTLCVFYAVLVCVEQLHPARDYLHLFRQHGLDTWRHYQYGVIGSSDLSYLVLIGVGLAIAILVFREVTGQNETNAPP